MGKEKFTFEFVKNYISENECELLETDYINSRISMRILHLPCNKIFTTSFSNFRLGRKCHACSTGKPTIEYLKKFFLDEGCILLDDTYKDSKQLMTYICICGDENTIRFQCFKKGIRCRVCGVNKKMISEEKNLASYRWKDYFTPSGELRRIQGYEGKALDILLKLYPESDVKTSIVDMPKITYEYKKVTSRYYPDIYIPSENKVIEVKSTYTYQKELSRNIMKALATRRHHVMETWLFVKGKGDEYTLHVF
jgi:hypothetical protein